MLLKGDEVGPALPTPSVVAKAVPLSVVLPTALALVVVGLLGDWLGGLLALAAVAGVLKGFRCSNTRVVVAIPGTFTASLRTPGMPCSQWVPGATNCSISVPSSG